jgi:exopolysaccharide biosynthesis predicted pyruvyltransferase EpsI
MAVNDPIALCQAILRNQIAPVVASARCAALIGFPDDQNCGDHANWLGAIKLLSELGLEVVYAAPWSAVDLGLLSARVGKGVIFLASAPPASGGSRSVLEKLLISLPNRTIILPGAASSAHSSITPTVVAAVSGHPDLLIFARDSAARKTVEQAFAGRSRMEMAPPLSFMLGPQQLKADPEYDIVWVARTGRKDSSVETAARLLTQSAEKLDLPEFPDGLDIDVVVKRRPPTVMLTDWSSLVFRSQEARLACNALDLQLRAQAYVDRGLQILSLGRLVITDRVGAHVACLLLRLPHVFCDDGSGQNRAFFESWTKNSELCRFADSPAKAWSQARTMLRGIKTDEP